MRFSPRGWSHTFIPLNAYRLRRLHQLFRAGSCDCIRHGCGLSTLEGPGRDDLAGTIGVICEENGVAIGHVTSHDDWRII